MIYSLAEINQKITDIGERPHKIMVIVGGGKFTLLKKLSEVFHYEPINVNYELSKQLIELESIDPMAVKDKLEQIVSDKDPVLLYNLELLFDHTLQINPLDAIKPLSRNRIIVLFWPGTYNDSKLFYSKPGHIDYFEEFVGDLQIFEIEDGEII